MPIYRGAGLFPVELFNKIALNEAEEFLASLNTAIKVSTDKGSNQLYIGEKSQNHGDILLEAVDGDLNSSFWDYDGGYIDSQGTWLTREDITTLMTDAQGFEPDPMMGHSRNFNQYQEELGE